jgi:hypothetical protein
MARPRIFVSSTFYDLRQIRADIERFIAQMGYEPVLNEKGTIPYSSDKKLEESAYRSVELSDILVSIVGGRYGSSSNRQPYSISQVELKTALERSKPVFIFVEKSVLAEYGWYLKNKAVPGIQYNYGDNPQIYAFLEEVHALPMNNPIFPFETAQDITDYLREQWGGLFQGYLQQQSRLKEVQIIENLANTAKALDQMVKFLSEQYGSSEKALQDILLSNHPMFQQLRAVTSTDYRIFFSNHRELELWLRARSYKEVMENGWDSPDYEEWTRNLGSDGKFLLLKVYKGVFDAAGKLKVFTQEGWDKGWVSQERREPEPPEPEASGPLTEEDIPF